MKRLKDMKEQMKKAREDKDSAAIKKLRMVGNMLQAMQHEKSFGTGSVRYELLEIKDKVDSLAKAENLDGIVSKWELNFHGGNIEVVDVTEKIALLFEPNEKFKKMLPDLLKSEPMKEAYLLHD
jgi:Ni,Fe-hydrogenase I large subunit